MTKIVRHVALPALAPIAFFAAASTPVDVLGCRNRGLLALTIALVGALAGLGAALFALRGRLRGEKGSFWWVASTLLLALPAAAVVVLSRNAPEQSDCGMSGHSDAPQRDLGT